MKELVNVNVPKPKGVEEVTAPEAKKQTVGERIAEAREDAIVLEATEKAHGLGGKGGKVEQEPSIQSQIVTNAMNTQNKLIEAMDAKTEKLEVKVEEANKSVTAMSFELLQDQMKQLKETQQEAIAAVKEAQAAGAPKDAFGYYTQVSGELEKLVAKITPAKESAAAQSTGMSEATQIKLKELDLEQTRILHQIQADAEASKKQWDLKLLEFTDNKTIRMLEYQDKTHFREKGLEGFSDLVNALGAGVSNKGGPVSSSRGDKVTQQSESEEAEAGAYISSFKCDICGSEVPVVDGQTVAKCPNPDCGATFTIKAKT